MLTLRIPSSGVGHIQFLCSSSSRVVVIVVIVIVIVGDR
jgi:hypothetical protein